jgi:hypothetical protein
MSDNKPAPARLRLIHVELAEANAFVDALHRHHKRVVGHKFSIGALDTTQEGHFADGKLVGVAIVGRPVARCRDDGVTLEVTRLCTDGTRNACSFLYGACARAAFALGYERIGTYTLQEEGGASLRASGWRLIGERSGGNWKNRGGRAIESTPNKYLWEVSNG